MILKLYIVGHGSISKRAIKNLKAICELPELEGLCDIEVIDLSKDYNLAEKEKILATPVLIRKEPLPQKRIIGDLSNYQKVLEILEEPISKFL